MHPAFIHCLHITTIIQSYSRRGSVTSVLLYIIRRHGCPHQIRPFPKLDIFKHTGTSGTRKVGLPPSHHGGVTSLNCSQLTIVSVAQTPNPGHLFKRALPTWKNFTPNDATNPQIVQLTQAFKDMATVVNAVLAADQNTFNIIFLKYFRDGMQSAVKQVLSNM